MCVLFRVALSLNLDESSKVFSPKLTIVVHAKIIIIIIYTRARAHCLKLSTTHIIFFLIKHIYFNRSNHFFFFFSMKTYFVVAVKHGLNDNIILQKFRARKLTNYKIIKNLIFLKEKSNKQFL